MIKRRGQISFREKVITISNLTTLERGKTLITNSGAALRFHLLEITKFCDMSKKFRNKTAATYGK